MLGDIGLSPSFAENIVQLVEMAGFEVEQGAEEQYVREEKRHQEVKAKYDAQREKVSPSTYNGELFKVESVKALALIDIAEVLTLMFGVSE
jgi:hypothetical protein